MGALRRFYLVFLATILLAAAAALPARATTLTFDSVSNSCGVCPGFPTSVSESGYTISGSPATFGGTGQVHLDDSGTSFSNYMAVTGPGRFSVSRVDIFGMGSALVDVNDQPLAYNNVWFQGFRGGVSVAQMFFSTGTVAQNFLNMSLGGVFTNLDKFVITALWPSAAEMPRGAYCANAPCGHFSVDNLVVSVVPLPGSLILFGTGFFALIILVGRRRKFAA
jgi:hypothetical protein